MLHRPLGAGSIEVDLTLIDHYDRLLNELELYLVNTAKRQDFDAFYRLHSIPGMGKILPLTLAL